MAKDAASQETIAQLEEARAAMEEELLTLEAASADKDTQLSAAAADKDTQLSALNAAAAAASAGHQLALETAASSLQAAARSLADSEQSAQTCKTKLTQVTKQKKALQQQLDDLEECKGQEVAEQGSPEARVFALVPAEGGILQDALMEAAGAAGKVGMAKAVQSKWLEVREEEGGEAAAAAASEGAPASEEVEAASAAAAALRTSVLRHRGALKSLHA